MRILLAATAVLAYALLAAAMISPAFAADTAVTVPWGDWIASAASHSAEILVMIGLWMLRRLPGQVVAVLQMVRADQLLERAVDYGINAVAGAARGRSLTVDVGSEVAAQALRYAIDNGPGWLVSWMGGEEGVRQKIIARLELVSDASMQ